METAVQERVRELIRNQKTCVLATVSGNQPHCSLMAYTTNETCSEIYLITDRNTKKYRNVTENPLVSLLIDSRETGGVVEPGRTMALTLSGRFEPVSSRHEEERIHRAFKDRHPGLGEIHENPNRAVLRIKVESFLFLQGPTQVHYGDIPRT